MQSNPKINIVHKLTQETRPLVRALLSAELSLKIQPVRSKFQTTTVSQTQAFKLHNTSFKGYISL